MSTTIIIFVSFLFRQLAACRESIQIESKRIASATGLEQKAVHLERSSVHGLHIRVTKKDSANALKKLSAAGEHVSTLSVQKAGTLFVTTKVMSDTKDTNTDTTVCETALSAAS
jgi:hypothetical protein